VLHMIIIVYVLYLFIGNNNNGTPVLLSVATYIYERETD
jgi:hypothetical protein